MRPPARAKPHDWRKIENRPGDQSAASGEFMVEPGVLQARLVAVGEKSGRIGAVTRRIEVPAPGEYRVSTPILTDALRPAANGLPPQPVLRARRSFAPRGRIYCQFQVYGARRDGGRPPQVEASLLLRQADGSVVRESQRTPIAPSGDGLLVRLVGLPLEGLAPVPTSCSRGRTTCRPAGAPRRPAGSPSRRSTG